MASRSEGDRSLSCPSSVVWWDTSRSLLPTSTLGTRGDEGPCAGAGMTAGAGVWLPARCLFSL